MSVQNVLKNINVMLSQMSQILVIGLLIALVAAIETKRKQMRLGYAKPRTAEEAIREVLSHNGYVLVGVDPQRCGYCRAVKIMLEARGIPYYVVDISDLPDEELEKFAETIGIEWVPALLKVEDGKIVWKYLFKGKEEEDIPVIRELS